jgi:hypothetical protein
MLVLAMAFLSVTHLGLSMLSSAGRATLALLCFIGLWLWQLLLLSFLIPRYGSAGAVYSTTIAAGTGLVLVLGLLHHFFATRYPGAVMLKIAGGAGTAYLMIRTVQPYLATRSKLWTVLALGSVYSLYLGALYLTNSFQISRFQKDTQAHK